MSGNTVNSLRTPFDLQQFVQLLRLRYGNGRIGRTVNEQHRRIAGVNVRVHGRRLGLRRAVGRRASEINVAASASASGSAAAGVPPRRIEAGRGVPENTALNAVRGDRRSCRGRRARRHRGRQPPAAEAPRRRTSQPRVRRAVRRPRRPTSPFCCGSTPYVAALLRSHRIADFTS